MDWPRYIRDFETHLRLERNLADNSVQAYLRDVSHLRRFAEPLGLEPADITADHLRQLLLQLNQTDIAVTTQCRIISGLRTFFHMLVIEDVLTENPAELLEMPARPRHLPDVLSDREIEAMQATFDRSPKVPGAASMFCSESTPAISEGIRLYCFMTSGFSQIRMEYVFTPGL